MNAENYEPLIEAAYRALLGAKSSADAYTAGKQLTALIIARNAERTPEQIAQLEQERGLR